VRIITGKFRGKKISAPASLPVRPTTDFAKGGLFNILANHFDFEKVKVLDLFSGTGNISYEFISRGTKKIVAVDDNNDCAAFIRNTFSKLNAGNAQIVKQDVFKYLKHSEGGYDIIFADPPFELPDSSRLPVLVFEKKLLNPGGWFVFEHSFDKNFDDLPGFKEKRAYGNVAFSIFIA
jgi:16S rRNA (guanine966-N2)-methyltransferase